MHNYIIQHTSKLTRSFYENVSLKFLTVNVFERGFNQFAEMNSESNPLIINILDKDNL